MWLLHEESQRADVLLTINAAVVDNVAKHLTHYVTSVFSTSAGQSFAATHLENAVTKNKQTKEAEVNVDLVKRKKDGSMLEQTLNTPMKESHNKNRTILTTCHGSTSGCRLHTFSQLSIHA